MDKQTDDIFDDFVSIEAQKTEMEEPKKLTFGLRTMIYSYCDLLFLLNTVTKLSKEERQKLPESELLNQKRCLKIYIKAGIVMLYPQLEYASRLATCFELQVEKMEEQDVLIFQTIMHLISLT